MDFFHFFFFWGGGRVKTFFEGSVDHRDYIMNRRSFIHCSQATLPDGDQQLSPNRGRGKEPDITRQGVCDAGPASREGR